MSEKSTFIRYVLSGALTLTGLLFPAVGADAQGLIPPKRSIGSASSDAPAPSETSRDLRSLRSSARVYSGFGFDTCQAPALATMNAWLGTSPYGAAGIYFGGRARACKTQTNLTADWVRQTTSAGWSLLPIYVGSQSPCVTGSNKNPYLIPTASPSAQGASEGKDAVKAAASYGIDPGSALYLDMEAYKYTDKGCATTTLKFIQNWNKQVEAAGYLSGFYSSADSGIRHIENSRKAGEPYLPDVVWFARWGVTASLTSEPSLAAGAWTPHGRIHQYHGAVAETHGGKKLTIDRDMIDAPVAVVG
jgi:hypothetical protein